MRDEFLWVEKYRPKTIEECILPSNIKKTFQDFLDKGEIPNMLLAGPAGCGKTTVAKALCNELGVDFYVINGSDEGRFLDTVRNTAKNFASTVSLSSTAKHKVIIIDEADNTTNDVQLLLRAFIEEFSGNCRFIFTCNFKNKILEPLHSRTTVVEFSIKGKERQGIAASFFKRMPVDGIVHRQGDAAFFCTAHAGSCRQLDTANQNEAPKFDTTATSHVCERTSQLYNNRFFALSRSDFCQRTFRLEIACRARALEQHKLYRHFYDFT